MKPAEKKIPPPAPAPVEAQPALPQAPEQPPLPSVPAESDSDSDGHMSDAPPEPMPDMEDSPSQGGDYESTIILWSGFPFNNGFLFFFFSPF